MTVAEGSIHVLWTEPHQEVRRDQDGDLRWCFTCRKKRAFAYVVLVPVEMSYYGPIRQIECGTCGTVDADCFPGTGREWSD